MTNTVRRVEAIKTMILELDIPSDILLLALKGAEYNLELRLAAEDEEMGGKEFARL